MTELLTIVHTEGMRALVWSIPCESCRASSGAPCRNQDGEVFPMDLPVPVHTSRIAPVWVIYRIGYQHGGQAMKEKLSE